MFLGAYSLLGQSEISPEVDPDRIIQDSITAPIKNGTFKTLGTLFAGKPGRAALAGLLVPGGGQIYNKRYWKAPVVWAIDGAIIYYYFKNRKLYRGFRDAYALKFTDPDASYLKVTDKNALREYRNRYLLRTEQAGIAFVVVHILSVIEAFTDAHLMDFDIDENLSMAVKNTSLPLHENGLLGVHLKYNF